jgi:hypothetical protein
MGANRWEQVMMAKASGCEYVTMVETNESKHARASNDDESRQK